MSATTFSNLIDTYALYRKLLGAGFTSEQAEAQVEILRVQSKAGEASLQDLATRKDLQAEVSLLRTELKADVSALRTELKADVSALRAELKADVSALRAEFKTDVAKLDKKISDINVKAFWREIIIAAALVGVMAKGFNWLGF